MSNSKTAAALQQAVTDSYAALIETHRFHWNFDGDDFYVLGIHRQRVVVHNLFTNQLRGFDVGF